MSAKALAEALDVPPNRISAILRGRRGITADTALRLSRYLGTTPELWMHLQKTYELRVAEIESGKQIAKRVKPHRVAAWFFVQGAAFLAPLIYASASDPAGIHPTNKPGNHRDASRAGKAINSGARIDADVTTP